MGSVKTEHHESDFQQHPESKSEVADFQTAIAATKFGKFNFILLLVTFPSTIAIQGETGIMSFIIPSAGCDLDLSPNEKGLLNSMAFAGMVISGFIWGFLLDTLGRKKMLFIGFSASVLVTVGKSLSTHVGLLYFFQFCGGSLTGGLYVAGNTYLHEFHSTEYRGKIQMIYGCMYCIANVIVPLLCSGIIGSEFNLKIGSFEYYSWNVLLLLSATPSFLAAIGFYCLPETPKYLMTCGNNEKALSIMRRMYRFNTGDKAEHYPITRLINESVAKNQPSTQKSSLKYFKLGWKQISPLFGREHVVKLVLVCTTQAMYQMVLSTLRIYIPQIFQADHDFKVSNNREGTLCEVLTILRSPTVDDEETACFVDLNNNFKVYMNYMIISGAALIGYVLAGTLINIFGRKTLLKVLNVLGTLSVGSLYFSPNMTVTLVLSSMFFACISVCFDIFVTIVVVLFPTTLRAMAFSLSLIIGRTLVVFGNVIVPTLVELGCAPPFIGWGGLSLGALFLTFFLPNTDKTDMK